MSMFKNGAVTSVDDLLNAIDYVEEPKFLQKTDVRLTDDFIEYILKAPKYPIGNVGLEENTLDLNFEFGTLNEDKKMSTATLDYCRNGVKFFAVKDKSNNLHLCALYTVNSGMGVSCGLYYLPNGKFNDICFIARLCYHNGTNDHINKLGNKNTIGKTQIHMHVQSEAFYDYCKHRAKSPQDFICALQSPDAYVVPGAKFTNIKQFTDLALKELNADNELIMVAVTDENKIIPAIKEQIDTYQRG